MDFDLTGEQRMLDERVQRFLAQRYRFDARLRILRSAEGWSREIWSGLAGLGLLALQAPAARGGVAPALVETMLAMAAVGRWLLLEPYLSSAVLGTALVRDLGSAEQRARWLPALAAGGLVAVPAHGEAGARDDPSAVAATARRAGAGWVISGRTAAVLHAPAADLLLVSARTGGIPTDERGLSLFAIPRDAPGVRLLPRPARDGRRVADVVLSAVAAGPEALLGPEGGAFPALAAVGELEVAALCAEGAGALEATLDAAVDPARARPRTGVPAGRLPALQHRTADLSTHVGRARSATQLAAAGIRAADSRERRRALSAARSTVGQACRLVRREALQLHGGTGVTDEMPVSHHVERLAVIEASLGDAEHHLERSTAESQ